MTEEQRRDLEQKAAHKKEIERRKTKERLRFYNIGAQVHKKQIEFHRNPAKIRVVFGGNRTGKTECGAVEAVWFARGNHPYKTIKRPTNGWVISPTNDVQKDVAQKKVLSYLQPEWIVDIRMREGRKPDVNNLENVSGAIESIHVKFVSNGVETGEVSVIGFKTCEQGREKFQGAKLDYVWFDEEPPDDIFKECQMRLVDLDGHLWMTMTPLKGLTWVYTSLYQKSQMFVPESRTWCIFMEWRDNPFLPADVIKQLEADMSEEERESRQYGRFVSLSGLVYSEFRYDVHVIEPFPIDPGNHYYIMMDNGWNTTAVLFSAVYDDEVVIFDEIYAHKKSVEDVCKEIIEKAKAHHWKFDASDYLWIWADSAVNQTNQQTGRNIASLLYDNGIYASTQVNKDVWAGIHRVKEYLKLREVPEHMREQWPKGRPRILITRNCVNLIKEFQVYSWAEGKEGAPKKEMDHCLDALRYVIMTRPEIREEVKEETTFEEQLVKRSFDNAVRNFYKRNNGARLYR